METPHLDVALASRERSTSARLRDGVVGSAVNLAQLAAAIVVGIVIGKAAHLITAGESAMAWSDARAEGGLRAEPSRTPDASRASDPVDVSEPLGSIEPQGVSDAPRPRARSAGRASLRSNASARPAPATHGRPAAPGSWSVQPTNLAALAPALAAPLSVDVGRRSHRAVTAAHVQPPLEPASDDWLGEQLAILGRAERSLVEDDPESAVRSLDEYAARFPDGLLDPQMASIRQRVEERFTAFIFP